MRNRRGNTGKLPLLQQTNLQTICHILGRLMERQAPGMGLRKKTPGAAAAATAMVRQETIAEVLLKFCAI